MYNGELAALRPGSQLGPEMAILEQPELNYLENKILMVGRHREIPKACHPSHLLVI